MPKYVIERELPGAGKLSPARLQGGLPANRISQVSGIIDPATAE